ncbi:hypothetical protein OC844_007183, partial [Tilletia horrida]
RAVPSINHVVRPDGTERREARTRGGQQVPGQGPRRKGGRQGRTPQGREEVSKAADDAWRRCQPRHPRRPRHRSLCPARHHQDL